MVGKFVEFYGKGLDHLSLEDQATIANMAPEYGATCGFFPVDDDTLTYLRATGRDAGPHRSGGGLRQGPGNVAGRCDARSRSLATPFQPRSGPTVEPSLAGPQAAPGPRGAQRCERPHSPRCSTPSSARAAEPDKRAPVEGRNHDLGPWGRGDRSDHLLHKHVEPFRPGRCRPDRPQRAGQGPRRQAMGEDVLRAGQPGGHRLSGEGRSAGGS